MSVSLINYKNGKVRQYQESRKIHNNNPICQVEINVGCYFCKKDKKKGRKKVFKNLWCLYMHMTREHQNEPTIKERCESLADLIIQGVLV